MPTARGWRAAPGAGTARHQFKSVVSVILTAIPGPRRSVCMLGPVRRGRISGARPFVPSDLTDTTTLRAKVTATVQRGVLRPARDRFSLHSGGVSDSRFCGWIVSTIESLVLHNQLLIR